MQNLNSAVEPLNSLQLFESSDYSEIGFLNNEVTATFSDTSSKPSSCNDTQYSTAEFRLNIQTPTKVGLIVLGLFVLCACGQKGPLYSPDKPENYHKMNF